MLASFRDAVDALERSMSFLASGSKRNDPLLVEQFRNSAILCFQCAHELAITLIKQKLGQTAADPAAIDKMAYIDVIRAAAEAGLIDNVNAYKDYGDKRTITTKAYEQATAQLFIAILPTFLDDMKRLLTELEKRKA